MKQTCHVHVISRIVRRGCIKFLDPHPVPLPQPLADDYPALVGGRGGPSFKYMHNCNLEGPLSRPPGLSSHQQVAAGEGRGEGQLIHLLISYRKPLPAMLRQLKFIHHRNRVILHGNLTLTIFAY